MFPLYDQGRVSLRKPQIIILLVVVNVVIYLLSFLALNYAEMFKLLGVVPSEMGSGKWFVNLFTSTFVHAGPLHLLGNMWFLWVFGDNVEDLMGSYRFLIFYLLVGAAAAFVHTLVDVNSSIPAVGASGAISGVMGAYLIFFRKNKIKCFMLIVYRPVTFLMPAPVFLVIWLLLQILYSASPSSVAYAAHIGGFIAGIPLAYLLKRKVDRQDYFVSDSGTREI